MPAKVMLLVTRSLRSEEFALPRRNQSRLGQFKEPEDARIT